MAALHIKKELLQALYLELRLALKYNDLDTYRIIQALIWLGEGLYSMAKIAELLNVSRQTIFNWLKTFMVKGIKWFRGERYPLRGRKSKLSKAQKQALYDLILAGPEKSGFTRGGWNTAMIAEVILRQFRVKYNPRYLSSLLKKMGLSYQKAKFITHHYDEEKYEKARQNWAKKTWPKLLEQSKETGAIILFLDEVSFAMWGSLARTWAPIGKQPLVKTSGIRKGLKMFGAIAFQDGAFHFRESLNYKVTVDSLKTLKATASLPQEIVSALKQFKSKAFTSKKEFLAALEKTLTSEELTRYRDSILEYTQISGRFSGATYQEFLEQLLAAYPKRPIILVEDSAPYHCSGKIREFKEKHKDRLFIEPLPTFSPDFNPIEKLWRNTKRDATHLKYFKTFDDLRAAVAQTFKTYMEDASKVVCVMEKLRFEAGLAG
jgi:transposase